MSLGTSIRAGPEFFIQRSTVMRRREGDHIDRIRSCFDVNQMNIIIDWGLPSLCLAWWAARRAGAKSDGIFYQFPEGVDKRVVFYHLIGNCADEFGCSIDALQPLCCPPYYTFFSFTQARKKSAKFNLSNCLMIITTCSEDQVTVGFGLPLNVHMTVVSWPRTA